MPSADPPELTLSAGDWRCTVAPLGASLRRLWLEPTDGPRRDVLWGYAGAADKKGGQGDVLFPFPGRIRDGRYTFQGVAHQLPLNDKQGPNAIHGFARSQVWEAQREGSAAHFRLRIRPGDHPGFPFDMEAVVGYELDATGLASAAVIRNNGDTPAPVGIGFHPYIACPAGVDAAVVQAWARSSVELGADLLPTGRVAPVPSELDFRRPRAVGPATLNHCLADFARTGDGFATVLVDDVRLWFDEAFSHIVLYTGDALGPDARRGLAVEPMTCGPDAFNQPQLGRVHLAAGATLVAKWGISLARANPH